MECGLERIEGPSALVLRDEPASELLARIRDHPRSLGTEAPRRHLPRPCWARFAYVYQIRRSKVTIDAADKGRAIPIDQAIWACERAEQIHLSQSAGAGQTAELPEWASEMWAAPFTTVRIPRTIAAKCQGDVLEQRRNAIRQWVGSNGGSPVLTHTEQRLLESAYNRINSVLAECVTELRELRSQDY